MAIKDLWPAGNISLATGAIHTKNENALFHPEKTYLKNFFVRYESSKIAV